MKIFVVIGYFVLGLIQLAAILSGLEDWLDLHAIIAIPLAMILAYIPLLGSVLGTLGAINAWGWEIWQAVLLFFWPILIFVFAAYQSERSN